MKGRVSAAVIAAVALIVGMVAWVGHGAEQPAPAVVVDDLHSHAHDGEASPTGERMWVLDLDNGPIHFGEKSAVAVCGLLAERGATLSFAQLRGWGWTPQAAVAVLTSSTEQTCPDQTVAGLNPATFEARLGAGLVKAGPTIGYRFGTCVAYMYITGYEATMYTLSKSCAKFRITAYWPIPGGGWGFRTRTIYGPSYTGTKYSVWAYGAICFADFWAWGYGTGGQGIRMWPNGAYIYLGSTN